MSGPMGLNPFENQVYFYRGAGCEDEGDAACLNPFENQVYFYWIDFLSYVRIDRRCLNPFENQVYFYVEKALADDDAARRMS